MNNTFNPDMRFEIGENARVNLNLSNRTNEIIERDMVVFNKDSKNKSGFLNRIFQNYYDDFPLAPQVLLKNIKMLPNKIKQDNIGKDMVSSAVGIFSRNIMKDAIDSYSKKYPSEFVFKLKLNQNVAKTLELFDEASYFNWAAPRSGIGFYLKIIFETYAELNKTQREKIFFKDEFAQVQSAIKNKRKLKIQKYNSKEYITIVPISIDKDDDKNYHEVKYIPEIDDSMSLSDGIPIEYYAISFTRIDDIQGINRSINEEELNIIDLIKQNISIIQAHHNTQKDKQDIVIKFNYHGQQRFILEEDDLPFSLIPVDDQKYTYKFIASESEVFWHFFKYGYQAEIIEPNDLREKFSKFYDYAAKHYAKIPNNQIKE